MPPSVEPLSNVDAAWLGMEDPTNLMMVTGILTFETPVDVDYFKDVLKHRFLPYKRFRQRVVRSHSTLVPPYWQMDPTFDLNAHVHRVGLPPPGDQSALQELASDLLSAPLDFSKPLWQIHIVERYGPGSAAIVRLHHCIADGMALVSVLLSLTDLSPDAPRPQGEPAYDDKADDDTGGPLEATLKQASARLNTARQFTKRFVREGIEALITPAKMLDLTLQGADSALAVGRLVLRPPDPQTIFKGPLGVAKRGSWSRPLLLSGIKTIKNSLGGTVNDVLVSAMTGGLQRYLLGRGESVEGLNFRAAVPVNLRAEDEMGTLGNRFGIVYLTLPVGITDPQERLAEVSQRMTALKNTPEAIAAFGILNIIGMSPSEAQNNMVGMFAAKATAVMTNVPGPSVPLYLAGSKIDSLMFWVPQSGRVSLGISIISYAGRVWLGVAADARLIPDPDTIIEGFYAEYDALMALSQQAAARGKSQPGTQAPTMVQEVERCQAQTRSGRRCRNRALDGSSFCHIHQ
jgi:diacylglycerol O-acyltransferase